MQIGSVWITPFFESPEDDIGYDISNYTNINPKFGTMKDFEELSEEAEKRGRYVLLIYMYKFTKIGDVFASH